MQAEVAPLLIINVNFGLALPALLLRHLRFAILDRRDFNLAVHLVIAWTRRHALGKFAVMIGDKIPCGTFLACGMDRHANSVDGAVIRAKGCAEDKPVGIFVLVLLGLLPLVALVFIFLGFVILRDGQATNAQRGRQYGGRS